MEIEEVIMEIRSPSPSTSSPDPATVRKLSTILKTYSAYLDLESHTFIEVFVLLSLLILLFHLNHSLNPHVFWVSDLCLDRGYLWTHTAHSMY